MGRVVSAHVQSFSGVLGVPQRGDLRLATLPLLKELPCRGS